MQIGAVAYQPYIYNTNSISRASMNKIAPIGDDLTTAKTDYSGLLDDSKNINPLKKGQTADFASLFDMQMQMSIMNQSRIMVPSAEEQATQAVTAKAPEEAATVKNPEAVAEALFAQ